MLHLCLRHPASPHRHTGLQSPAIRGDTLQPIRAQVLQVSSGPRASQHSTQQRPYWGRTPCFRRQHLWGQRLWLFDCPSSQPKYQRERMRFFSVCSWGEKTVLTLFCLFSIDACIWYPGCEGDRCGLTWRERRRLLVWDGQGDQRPAGTARPPQWYHPAESRWPSSSPPCPSKWPPQPLHSWAGTPVHRGGVCLHRPE